MASAPRPVVTDDDRRRLLGVRHRLAPGHAAASPVDAAGAVVALHATDPATVYLSVAARTGGGGAPTAAVDAALYDEAAMVRMLAMRRTLWAVPTDAVAVVTAAATRAVAANERRRLLQHLDAGGFGGDAERWLAAVHADVLAALAERGEALATELTAAVPELKHTYVIDEGKAWGGETTATTRVLGLLAAEGRIVRGRPRGTWTSSQHRWRLAPAVDELPEAEARARLAQAWLAAFGPAPVADLKWWAGWTVAATKAALAAAGAVEVETASGPAMALPEALDDLPADVEPWAALLPALDPTTMGWQARDWYLDPAHRPALFDRNGNAGPTVWWCGRVVGGWAHRPDGEVVVRLLDDVGADATAAVEAARARTQAWLDAAGGVVKPRFRTPLEQELCR